MLQQINFKNFKCGVEIPVFLVFFSMLLGAPIAGNFVMYRTCYVIMEKNETACAQLGLNTTDNATQVLEKQVQEVANYIHIIMQLFTLIIPCILCLFVGPYSDKKGRRQILIISLTGMIIHSLVVLIVALLPNLSPWYLAIQVIPTMLTGGMPTFITIAFCYLIDVTKADNRSMRMGLLQGALSFGMIIGLFLSSHVFKWIGYTGSFSVCLLLLIIAWLFTILFLKESIIITDNSEVKFFTFVHIKEMWHTTFKPRDGYNRTLLLGCMFSIVVLITAEASAGTESLLFRSKFHWNLEMLTNFASVSSVISIIGMCVCIYVLHKILKISECVLIMMGLTGCILGTGITAFAEYDWQIYTAAGIRIPAGLISPMIRSLVSNIITQEETGKIFSFCIAIESFCAMFAGPMYTIVYTETIDVFPGAFDLIPIAMYIGIMFYFVYVMVLMKTPNAVVFLEKQDEVNDNQNENNEIVTTKFEKI